MTDVSLPCIYTLITLLNMVIMIRLSDLSQGKAYLSKLLNVFVQFEHYIFVRGEMEDDRCYPYHHPRIVGIIGCSCCINIML